MLMEVVFALSLLFFGGEPLQVMQDSNTSDMTFSVAHIISFLSQGMTLAPGTVILTGTPEV